MKIGTKRPHSSPSTRLVQEESARITVLKRLHGERGWQSQGRGRCLRCGDGGAVADGHHHEDEEECPQFVNKRGRLLCEYCGCVLAAHQRIEADRSHDDGENNSNQGGSITMGRQEEEEDSEDGRSDVADTTICTTLIMLAALSCLPRYTTVRYM